MNPASPAVRVPYSFSHFDVDLGIGVSFSPLSSTDFFNTGKSERQEILTGSFAIALQSGSWGFGLSFDPQLYRLPRKSAIVPTDSRLRGQYAVNHMLLAKSFADGQLVVGLGVRTVLLGVIEQPGGAGDQLNFAGNQDQPLFATEGAGAEIGVLLRPNDQPYRIGLALRSPLETQTSTDAQVLFAGTPDVLYPPENVSVPWEVEVGLALQFGPRPLNPRWIDPSDLLERARRRAAQHESARERLRNAESLKAQRSGQNPKAAEQALEAELEAQAALDDLNLIAEEERADVELRTRYLRMPRQYLLVSTALRITGPTEEAVGLESFLDRTVYISGETPVVSPRLGLETEVVPNWVKVRAGTYGEPTRFSAAQASGRLHGTLGFDLKLYPPWSVFGAFHESTSWRVGAVLDVAERYLSWGLTAGIWH